MIRVGLTSFREHERLTGKKDSRLFDYAGFLPLVELDTAYYGIPKKQSVENWLKEVPEDFRFVIKVYQGISTQGKWQEQYPSEEEMVHHFLEVMQPMSDAQKLFCFLVQFPASFKCTKKNVAYLRKLHQWFRDFPVAIEFRDSSWYSEEYLERTRSFMERARFSLAIIDEPQLLNATIPFDSTVTNRAFALVRLHGRNQKGWQSNDSDWRKKRTLYRYSETELMELAKEVKKIQEQTEEVAVIFNNNSGGDAADNARAFLKILNLQYQGLNPAQIELF